MGCRYHYCINLVYLLSYIVCSHCADSLSGADSSVAVSTCKQLLSRSTPQSLHHVDWPSRPAELHEDQQSAVHAQLGTVSRRRSRFSLRPVTNCELEDSTKRRTVAVNVATAALNLQLRRIWNYSRSAVMLPKDFTLTMIEKQCAQCGAEK